MVIEFERVADSVMQSTIVQKMSANQKLVDPMPALRMLLRRDVGIVQRQVWAVDATFVFECVKPTKLQCQPVVAKRRLEEADI